MIIYPDEAWSRPTTRDIDHDDLREREVDDMFDLLGQDDEGEADARCVLCARVIDPDGEGEWPDYDLFELRAADGRRLGIIEVCDACLAAGRVPATVGRA